MKYGKLTIYTNKDDKVWLEELKKYAKENKWSVSQAVRDILSEYFLVKEFKEYKEPPEDFVPEYKPALESLLKSKEVHAEKMDTAEWENKMSSKVKPEARGDTYEEKIKNCDQLRTLKDGTHDCYKFNNGVQHQPFCKQYCWPRVDLWKDKARP